MTALLSPTTYTVDPWDPGYGVAYGDDLAGREPTAALDLSVELPAQAWRPVTPQRAAAPPPVVLFLDGVRRIDARVWVHGPKPDGGGLVGAGPRSDGPQLVGPQLVGTGLVGAGPQPVPGIAASLAVGLVRCDGATAAVADVRVDRSLYTTAAAASDLVTRHATYTARRVRPASRPGTAEAGSNGAAGVDVLSLAVQRRLGELETELATADRTDGALLVVDGPLRAHATRVAHAVGYVKTHHVPYLPPAQAETIAAMTAGQRSPVFAMTTSWPRHSWYLRLAGGAAAPWSGIVRLECPTDLAPADAIALADLTARVLPPLASTPHKDPRAPQNLVPIGGLERHLRHRLGDAALLYRSLRAATRS